MKQKIYEYFLQHGDVLLDELVDNLRQHLATSLNISYAEICENFSKEDLLFLIDKMNQM